MSAPADRRNPISTHVIEAVADRTRTDPVAVEPPLYEELDPDALDGLFEAGAAFRVQFTYAGHEIEVEGGDGGIDVEVREAAGG